MDLLWWRGGDITENSRDDHLPLFGDYVLDMDRVSSTKTVERTILYLGEINDKQQAEWRKTLAAFDQDIGTVSPSISACSPGPLPDGALDGIAWDGWNCEGPSQSAATLRRWALFFGSSLPGAFSDWRASSRETVAGWTLNSRAASAAVFRPLETIFPISACCCGDS